MIGLYLIAAHLAGDFLFQNRWQAALKLESRRMREQHVIGYAVPFVPLAIIYGNGVYGSAGFMLWLVILHFATDSRRFRSTLGDVVQWQVDRRRAPGEVRRAWVTYLYGPSDHYPTLALGERMAAAKDIAGRTLWFPPPNPWPPTPLMVDQTLHLIQLAVLGAIFLT